MEVANNRLHNYFLVEKHVPFALAMTLQCVSRILLYMENREAV
jgi:hypothetical protein